MFNKMYLLIATRSLKSRSIVSRKLTCYLIGVGFFMSYICIMEFIEEGVYRDPTEEGGWSYQYVEGKFTCLTGDPDHFDRQPPNIDDLIWDDLITAIPLNRLYNPE